MPESNYLSLYSFTSEPPKKAPIIKLSCGIGDTDGFPAFDVDSDQYAAKDDSKWGFLITGGAEFHMPLTVFQVNKFFYNNRTHLHSHIHNLYHSESLSMHKMDPTFFQI